MWLPGSIVMSAPIIPAWTSEDSDSSAVFGHDSFQLRRSNAVLGRPAKAACRFDVLAAVVNEEKSLRNISDRVLNAPEVLRTRLRHAEVTRIEACVKQSKPGQGIQMSGASRILIGRCDTANSTSFQRINDVDG